CPTRSTRPSVDPSTKSVPGSTRPAKSGWSASTPESRTATNTPAPVAYRQASSSRNGANCSWACRARMGRREGRAAGGAVRETGGAEVTEGVSAGAAAAGTAHTGPGRAGSDTRDAMRARWGQPRQGRAFTVHILSCLLQREQRPHRDRGAWSTSGYQSPTSRPVVLGRLARWGNRPVRSARWGAPHSPEGSTGEVAAAGPDRSVEEACSCAARSW